MAAIMAFPSQKDKKTTLTPSCPVPKPSGMKRAGDVDSETSNGTLFEVFGAFFGYSGGEYRNRTVSGFPARGMVAFTQPQEVASGQAKPSPRDETINKDIFDLIENGSPPLSR